MKIFISYSHQDQDVVNKINDRLISKGHNVWIAPVELRPGDNVMEKIQSALENSEAVVFVISKHSINSTWVQREYSAVTFHQITKGL